MLLFAVICPMWKGRVSDSSKWGLKKRNIFLQSFINQTKGVFVFAYFSGFLAYNIIFWAYDKIVSELALLA